MSFFRSKKTIADGDTGNKAHDGDSDSDSDLAAAAEGNMIERNQNPPNWMGNRPLGINAIPVTTRLVAEASAVSPRELVGHRIYVDGRGAGTVQGPFKKGSFLGWGPTKHTVQFDDGPVEKVKLARHGNKGTRFILYNDGRGNKGASASASLSESESDSGQSRKAHGGKAHRSRKAHRSKARRSKARRSKARRSKARRNWITRGWNKKRNTLSENINAVDVLDLLDAYNS